MTTEPRPVSKALLIPDRPRIYAPVGKSGPNMVVSINSLMVTSGLSITSITESITSERLCGGMFVAIPTAIPVPPLAKMFGKRAGITTGSRSSPS